MITWTLCGTHVVSPLGHPGLVLQRKPFTSELFFCWANAGFFTFS